MSITLPSLVICFNFVVRNYTNNTQQISKTTLLASQSVSRMLRFLANSESNNLVLFGAPNSSLAYFGSLRMNFSSCVSHNSVVRSVSAPA